MFLAVPAHLSDLCWSRRLHQGNNPANKLSGTALTDGVHRGERPNRLVRKISTDLLRLNVALAATTPTFSNIFVSDA